MLCNLHLLCLLGKYMNTLSPGKKFLPVCVRALTKRCICCFLSSSLSGNENTGKHCPNSLLTKNVGNKDMSSFKKQI